MYVWEVKARSTEDDQMPAWNHNTKQAIDESMEIFRDVGRPVVETIVVR